MNQTYIETEIYRGLTEVKVHQTEIPEQEAELAIKLLLNLSIVAGKPCKEDSAGRQAFRLLKPFEVADRACDIAHHAFAQFKARGWLLQIPVPKLPKLSQPNQDH